MNEQDIAAQDAFYKHRLKTQAATLIMGRLRSAGTNGVLRHGEDYDDCAYTLLDELEPIILRYALLTDR